MYTFLIIKNTHTHTQHELTFFNSLFNILKIGNMLHLL